MSTPFLSRIGTWFKRSPRGNGDLPLESYDSESSAPERVPATRSSFLRPWARHDATLASLQQGFQALTDLMGAIRENMEKQSARQDELLRCMSSLPQALEALPEQQRSHAETLRAMSRQFEQQHEQHARLVDILEKVHETGQSQQEMVQALHERVGAIDDHEQAISDNLKSVGSALQTVSRSSESSTHVLLQMRDNIAAHDGELQRFLQRQSARFTTMLVVAIVTSITALAVVSIFAYLVLIRMK